MEKVGTILCALFLAILGTALALLVLWRRSASGRKKQRREALAAQVLAIAQEMLAGRGLQSEISLDAPLGPDGLGFDSVARLDLLASVEKQCGVRIPEPFWGSRPLLSLNHLLDIARE